MKHIRFAMDLELVEPDTENLFKPSRKEISLWSIAQLVQFDTHHCLKEERWKASPSEVQTLRVNFKDKIQKIHQNGWKFLREMFSLTQLGLYSFVCLFFSRSNRKARGR